MCKLKVLVAAAAIAASVGTSANSMGLVAPGGSAAIVAPGGLTARYANGRAPLDTRGVLVLCAPGGYLPLLQVCRLPQPPR